MEHHAMRRIDLISAAFLIADTDNGNGPDISTGIFSSVELPKTFVYIGHMTTVTPLLSA
jgi:hypothetical protein